jgi:hypothetical protein
MRSGATGVTVTSVRNGISYSGNVGVEQNVTADHGQWKKTIT